jgi:hypothetical protein
MVSRPTLPKQPGGASVNAAGFSHREGVRLSAKTLAPVEFGRS